MTSKGDNSCEKAHRSPSPGIQLAFIGYLLIYY